MRRAVPRGDDGQAATATAVGPGGRARPRHLGRDHPLLLGSRPRFQAGLVEGDARVPHRPGGRLLRDGGGNPDRDPGGSSSASVGHGGRGRGSGVERAGSCSASPCCSGWCSPRSSPGSGSSGPLARGRCGPGSTCDSAGPANSAGSSTPGRSRFPWNSRTRGETARSTWSSSENRAPRGSRMISGFPSGGSSHGSSRRRSPRGGSTSRSWPIRARPWSGSTGSWPN